MAKTGKPYRQHTAKQSFTVALNWHMFQVLGSKGNVSNSWYQVTSRIDTTGVTSDQYTLLWDMKERAAQIDLLLTHQTEDIRMFHVLTQKEKAKKPL